MRHRNLYLLYVLLISILAPSGCIDDTSGYNNAVDGDSLDNNTDAIPWGISVVSTDYLSTSISILDIEQQQLFREGIIHSGSSDPGLSVALSGDIVLPSTPNPDNEIILIDRYPNSVLTFISPEDFSITGQLSVATGFASNPQDLLWLSRNKAYVTRYETNATPGKEEYDDGGDILIIDPASRTIIGNILIPQIEGNILPRPTHLVYANNLVWVAIDQLNKDFSKAGNGRIIAIDPGTDIIVHDIEIEQYKNCTGITYAKELSKLVVSCSGLFYNALDSQLGESGIVSIDLSANELLIETIIKADDRPYGFEVEMFNASHIICMHFGDLNLEINDSIVAIDIKTGEESLIHEASTPFGMGGTLADSDNNTVYIGDADPQSPAIHLYTFENGEFVKQGKIVSSPKNGLPPRHIRFY